MNTFLKKNLAIVVFSIFLLSACQNTNNNDKEIITSLIENSVCDEHRAVIEKNVSEDYNYSNEILPNITSVSKLEKLVFSKKTNRCLYTVSFRTFISKQSCKYFFAVDFPLKTELIKEYSCEKDGVLSSTNNKTLEQAYKDFSEKILEYDPKFIGLDDWES
jgi:protein involved in sex pheromone biosynthesis